MFRFAYRIVGDYMEAEDIVQEVLIKIWKKKDQFIQIENKEAWCMTLTRNLAIDKTRAKKKKIDSIDQFYHLKDKSADPYSQLKTNNTLAIIRNYMESLPENQKLVIHLRDVEGLTYKEISEITEYSLDQVKVYLHRARKTLREKLINLDL